MSRHRSRQKVVREFGVTDIVVDRVEELVGLCLPLFMLRSPWPQSAQWQAGQPWRLRTAVASDNGFLLNGARPLGPTFAFLNVKKDIVRVLAR